MQLKPGTNGIMFGDLLLARLSAHPMEEVCQFHIPWGLFKRLVSSRRRRGGDKSPQESLGTKAFLLVVETMIRAAVLVGG